MGAGWSLRLASWNIGVDANPACGNQTVGSINHQCKPTNQPAAGLANSS